MQKLFGVKKLNKAMRKAFYAATGIDIPMKLKSDFCYLPDKEKIHYTLLISERADLLFNNFLEKTFNYKVFNDGTVRMFCISILHEIGHHMTYHSITEIDRNYSQDEKVRIAAELAKNDTDENYSKYFFVPTELLATTWAINWIEKNSTKFTRLVIDVQEALDKFYDKNYTVNIPL